MQLFQDQEIEAKERPENVFEQRDAIEILGMEKEPLQLQPINQLFIAAVPRPENLVQHTGEIEIQAKDRPEMYSNKEMLLKY